MRQRVPAGCIDGCCRNEDMRQHLPKHCTIFERSEHSLFSSVSLWRGLLLGRRQQYLLPAMPLITIFDFGDKHMQRDLPMHHAIYKLGLYFCSPSWWNGQWQVPGTNICASICPTGMWADPVLKACGSGCPSGYFVITRGNCPPDSFAQICQQQCSAGLLTMPLTCQAR